MASNGLVANPSKTVFMILNQKRKMDDPILNIKVGDTMISQEEKTKLLGIIIEENQQWTAHFKQLNNALNSRLFQIRRVKNQIPRRCIMKIVQSLWFSKLRYGLQLCAITRTSQSDPQNLKMKSLQYAQNRLLRLLDGSRIKDRKSIRSLLQKFKLPSMNQIACEIKLMEAWKSINIQSYPVSIETEIKQDSDRTLRQNSVRMFDESSRTKIGATSFHISTAKLWNQTSVAVKNAKTKHTAKKAIKSYCNDLPL